jgi:uncharacterized protein
MEAAYRITIDGVNVTDKFDPHLISLTLTDTDGGRTDTLEIVIDDSMGLIMLPRAGALLQAAIWWSDPPPWGDSKAVQFIGVTDEPESSGSRNGGMTLQITAHSADLLGEGKNKKEKFKDDAEFGDVAEEWGKDAGYKVKVDQQLKSIKRDHWPLANESFLSWGRRISEEIGATFKTAYPNAVFVPRNSGSSAGGQQLEPLLVTRGQNLISWRLTPIQDRSIYKRANVRWYDRTAAKWMKEQVQIGGQQGTVDITETFKAADKDRAKNRATANSDESKRGKGGGEIIIDGDSRARSQVDCTLTMIRAGIDGLWRVTTARHTYTRGGGWTVSCDLEQPQDAASSNQSSQGA